MADDLDWTRDGASWPLHEASRFVSAAGLRWHVQQLGAGPELLMLHGTGASTHSWRGLAPLLAKDFKVTAVDLPGHGFTASGSPVQMSLPGMAHAVAQLLGELGVHPAVCVGHSAGAAVLIRMALDNRIAPRVIVSLNGALLPFRGFAGQVFSPLARMLALNPLVPRFFAWRASGSGAVDRVIASTGSRLDPVDVGYYARLFRSPKHVAAALAMMARWDLAELERGLGKLRTPLVLVAGSGDRAVPADDQFAVRDRVPGARVELVRGLGHLAHEERPDLVAEIILRAARETGALAAA